MRRGSDLGGRADGPVVLGRHRLPAGARAGDLSLLDLAIAQLEAGRWKAVLGTMTNIDMNFLAPILSRPGFDAEQRHHSPGK
jgi:hypothetical protein